MEIQINIPLGAGDRIMVQTKRKKMRSQAHPISVNTTECGSIVCMIATCVHAPPQHVGNMTNQD